MCSKWKDIDFIFYFIPEPTPRPRYSSTIGSFYVKGATIDREFFKKYLKENETEYELITTPCNFFCDFYLPIPSTMNRIEKVLSELRLIRPVSTPDWDNVGKKYSDMVQKELILNDSLIVTGQIRKFYSFKPRVEINISYMMDYDSKFNKKKIESWNYYKADPRTNNED
jgi:Holliday junction resolvase RusA-like endonuclease